MLAKYRHFQWTELRSLPLSLTHWKDAWSHSRDEEPEDNKANVQADRDNSGHGVGICSFATGAKLCERATETQSQFGCWIFGVTGEWFRGDSAEDLTQETHLLQYSTFITLAMKNLFCNIQNTHSWGLVYGGRDLTEQLSHCFLKPVCSLTGSVTPHPQDGQPCSWHHYHTRVVLLTDKHLCFRNDDLISRRFSECRAFNLLFWCHPHFS